MQHANNRAAAIQDDIQFKKQLAFSVIGGLVALVATAALPVPTYFVLSGIFTALWMGSNPAHWNNLQTTTKAIIGFGIMMGAIVFIQFEPISRLILSTFGAGAMSAFFVHERIFNPLQQLNQELRTACAQGNLDLVNELLAKDADPCAPDAQMNTAFHHVIKNHPQTAAILAALKQNVEQPDPDFKNVLAQIKGLYQDDVMQPWEVWRQRARELWNENTSERSQAFYRATYDVYRAYVPAFSNIFNSFAHYLRGIMASPRDDIDNLLQAPLRPVNQQANVFPVPPPRPAPIVPQLQAAHAAANANPAANSASATNSNQRPRRGRATNSPT